MTTKVEYAYIEKVQGIQGRQPVITCYKGNNELIKELY